MSDSSQSNSNQYGSSGLRGALRLFMDTLPPRPPRAQLSSSSKAAVKSIIDDGKRSRRRDRKRKTRSESQEAPLEATSSGSGSTSQPANNNISSSHTDTNGKYAKQTTFEDGLDFIPFLLPDADEELDHAPRNHDRGKEKARDDLPLDDRSKEQRRERSPLSRGERDRGRGSDKERERSRERNGRDRDRDRDKDKDKERNRNGDRDRGEDRHLEQNGTKRKYEMIFDPDDGYSNKRQRTDAASRKAPWVAGLNLERCKNVAEMYVSV